MASTQTQVKDDGLKLEAPDAVAPVAIDAAAGLVPLEDGQKSELDRRVDRFVDDLLAQDANSPEFGKRVDALAALGRKEIADAAGQSNRFLDRPVRAIDTETGIGADLTELRRTVEELDPSTKGNLLTKRKILGILALIIFILIITPVPLVIVQ